MKDKTKLLEELIEFPCDFNLKVMGVNTPELVGEMSAIMQLHCKNFMATRDITSKPSKKGNYIALTIVIKATGKEQLDKIYQDLHNHPLVKITL